MTAELPDREGVDAAARRRAIRRAYNTAYQRHRRARLREENPKLYRQLQLAENLRRRQRHREQHPVPKRRGRLPRPDLAHLPRQERLRVLRRESQRRVRKADPERYNYLQRVYYHRNREQILTRLQQRRLQQKQA